MSAYTEILLITFNMDVNKWKHLYKKKAAKVNILSEMLNFSPFISADALGSQGFPGSFGTQSFPG